MEFTIMKPEEEFEPPSYKEPGRLLFHYIPAVGSGKPEVEVLSNDGSAFWLVEGGFPDYWVAENVHLELMGYYVIEGLTGHVYRSYEGEYDEEWDFTHVRRASEEETNGSA